MNKLDGNLTEEEKKLLRELKKYLNALNITLAVPQEIYECKKRCRELLKLAGELDERLK